MKTQNNNTKRSYSSPEIHVISLDNEISLVLSSRVIPPDPEQNEYIIEQEHFENTPFE